MKHAISFYIDDESEIIGLCGSVVVETDYDKAISCFNFNKDQLKTKNALYVGQSGQGMLINKEDQHGHNT